ncbi:hypothetical protein O9993_17185 [Vibrio lentus]|nr:hypothetical protein [Vibrio lentus]
MKIKIAWRRKRRCTTVGILGPNENGGFALTVALSIELDLEQEQKL